MRSIRWFRRIQLDAAADATARFGIPEDLTGRTVLDIGAWNGLFSFEAERRGAQVTAMDPTLEYGGNWGGALGFNFARRHLDSSVRFEPCSVFDLDPARHGRFDYVFFFGVLDHLTDPVEALRWGRGRHPRGLPDGDRLSRPPRWPQPQPLVVRSWPRQRPDQLLGRLLDTYALIDCRPVCPIA